MELDDTMELRVSRLFPSCIFRIITPCFLSMSSLVPSPSIISIVQFEILTLFSKLGFREFSNPKGIFRRGDQPDLLAALYPPYALAQGVADHAFKQAGM